MTKEICWEKQAKRDFDPVKIWNEAMSNSFIDKPINSNTEIKAAHKRSERSKKSAATMLVRNPNYFKELAAKRYQKNM